MKRNFTVMVVSLSLGVLCVVGIPAYARGGGHGGGGGHAGFSGGGHAGFSGGSHFSGAGRSYGGASTSHGAVSYGGRHYSPGVSAGHYGSYGGRSYAPRSATAGQVYGSHPRSKNITASGQFAQSPKYSGSYYVPRDQSATGFARKPGIQQRPGTTAKVGAHPGSGSSRQNITGKHRLDPKTTDRLRNWQGKTPGFHDAKRNHHENWRNRHHHGHEWWRHHCDAIVLIGGGFWGWYDGWWYPAWGYDPYYSYYDYDGPIYGYGGLQPDEIIADIQTALQQLGYYPYVIDGVFGSLTEAAIANYQRDYGLSVTGAIDVSTVRSLGLGS